MKKYIPHIVILIIGIVIGALCREHHFRNIVDNPQRDTIFVRDTFEYTREVLSQSTKVVHQKDTEYIYIEVRDTVEKEKKVYVPMPRQFYHTRVKDAEIFHSGIESRIDSLNIFSTTANITQTYLPKEKKHFITIYGSIGYMDVLRMPVGAKYLYRPIPWWGVGAKVEHDLALDVTGAYVTTEITFGF